MGLEEYRRKRDFKRTPEPRGRKARTKAVERRFVVQKHAARRLHYDFRLELDGVLKSWAVPKGPSLVPAEKRLAAQTEDHPLDYADFEGVIPKGEYGGGTVVVWDRGYWTPIGDPDAGLEKGDLTFDLAGDKLRGRWHLVRMRPRKGEKPSWLLIKGRDSNARDESAPEITVEAPQSVLTGRDLEEVARDADRVWSSGQGEVGGGTPVLPPADPRGLSGARKAPFPRSITPQLATLVDAAPEGEEWIHELKLDGYRVIARLEKGKVRLLTRSGQDWTDRFTPLAEAVATLPVDTACLDGEAVVLDAHGRSDFQALQQSFGQTSRLHFFLFDLLYLNGYDLRESTLVERKRLLQQLLARVPSGSLLLYSDHVVGHGEVFYKEACQRGVEGVVSKRADAAYRSQRTRSWLKVKCSRRQELVIAGFTEPAGSRSGLGALLLAVHDTDGTLRYAGKVGTGFDTQALLRLRKLLEPIEQSKPVEGAPRARGQHWVEPRYVAEISFTEWTRDGRVRHPVFVGLRDDKPAKEVRVETPKPVEEEVEEIEAAEVSAQGAPRGSKRTAKKASFGVSRTSKAARTTTKSPARAARATPTKPTPRSRKPSTAQMAEVLPVRSEVAGVRLSNPDRIYYPDVGITKSELASYYEQMADRVLPGMIHRPLSLVRCPEGREGECFYQKHADRTVPASVPRVVVKAGRSPYAMVDGLSSLVSLVQIGVLEFHVWGARADRLDRPDLLIVDLDPDTSVGWHRLAEAALLLRVLFEEFGLVAFVRSTGGKGLHVVVPLTRGVTWEVLKEFAYNAALQLVRTAPKQFTANMAKAKRGGKIFLDVFRNAPEATAIASWSARAHPGAPVAATLAWEELDSKERPVILLRDAAMRLKEPDPWAHFEDSRRPITKAMRDRMTALSGAKR
jgi:bifunctional non-homologous end joining protein LigD